MPRNCFIVIVILPAVKEKTYGRSQTYESMTNMRVPLHVLQI
jgi:hypothetical protein